MDKTTKAKIRRELLDSLGSRAFTYASVDEVAERIAQIVEENDNAE